MVVSNSSILYGAKRYLVPVLLGGGVLAALIGLLPNVLAWLTNEPPQFSFELNKTSGEAPLTIVANVDAYDPDNDDLEVSWFLEDELRTSGHLVTHDFTLEKPGEYKIEIVVSDGSKEKRKKQTVIVHAPTKKIGDLSMDGPLAINEPSSDYEIIGEIVTNGFPLELRVHNVIGGTTQIRAFPAGRANNGNAGPKGGDGRSGSGGSGEYGASGDAGGPGTPGHDGRHAGRIEIYANQIRSNLIVSNRGQNGGNGGAGGTGGNGGNGGQGSPSSAGFSIGGIGNCKSGPGRGGNGGNGGNGGAGGNAGKGGNGGPVLVEARDITGTLTIRTHGGEPGTPGPGGQRGKEGAGGPEGALNGPCGSAGRVGANGTQGNQGSVGATGASGDPADIEVVIDGVLESSSSGEFSK